MAQAPRVAIDRLADLRAWLAAHHGQRESVWLVLWRKGAGPHIPWPELVQEALCWGWIDSLPRKLDDRRTMLRLSPRKPGSGWSAINKAHVAALVASGRMQPAGLAAVERAQADGSWERLDGVETLAVPPDLAGALAAAPGAETFFANFPPSARRGILEWIAAARTAETRARRVAETARLAALNRKANHPAGRDAGPRPRAPSA